MAGGTDFDGVLLQLDKPNLVMSSNHSCPGSIFKASNVYRQITLFKKLQQQINTANSKNTTNSLSKLCDRHRTI